MRKRKSIAIIGCGYVGSALAEKLVEAGHDVVATTTSPERANELGALGVRVAAVEIAEVDRLRTILSDREVVYLTIAPRNRGVDYRDVYVAGARNVTTAVNEANVRRIIYTSSTRVYGQDDGSWVDETSPTEPADENGRVLVEAERVLLGPEERLENSRTVTVVRLSGIYGPGRDPAHRIAKLAGTQRSDGDAYVNLIHRDDIVTALVALLSVQHHGALNLSEDQPEPRRVFYDRVLARAGLPPIQWIDDSSPGCRGKRVRSDRIRELLNLELGHLAR